MSGEREPRTSGRAERGAVQWATVLASALAALAMSCLVLWLGGGEAAPRDDAAGVSAPKAGAAAAGSVRDAAGDASEIARLRDALALERAVRGELSERVAALAERVESLQSDRAVSTSDGADAEEASSDASSTASLGFRDEALIEAGVPDADAARIRAAWEKWELDKLYLTDEARRGGWVMSQRHRNRLNTLREELRQEIGDEDFDRLLYASGQNNRVRVGEVLDASPAGDAGIEVGDTLLAYDGQRIRRSLELRYLTGEGTPGENVAVDVLRDGEPVRVYLPRGPLGVILSEASEPPG